MPWKEIQQAGEIFFDNIDRPIINPDNIPIEEPRWSQFAPKANEVMQYILNNGGVAALVYDNNDPHIYRDQKNISSTMKRMLANSPDLTVDTRAIISEDGSNQDNTLYFFLTTATTKEG